MKSKRAGRRIATLAAILVLPMLAGCASIWAMAPRGVIDQVVNAPLVRVVHYPSPPMKLKRAAHVGVGWIVGGPLGLIFGHRTHQVEGEAALAENGLRPPVQLVQDNLARGLRAGMGLTRLDIMDEPLGSLRDLPEPLPGELVFRLHTDKTKFAFFLTDMNHYRFKFNLEAVLIRRSDGRVLWRDECSYNSNRTERPHHMPEGNPTLTALKDDGARELQMILMHAADVCTEQLLTDFLGTVPENRRPLVEQARVE